MDQRTARIAIVVGLLVVGGLVLANGFGNSGGVTAASSTPSATSTPKPTHSPKVTPSPQIKNVAIATFNGTSVSGCAGNVQTMLVADGYVAAQQPADATTKPIQKTVLYYRGGAEGKQNKSDAVYMSSTYFNDAKVAAMSAQMPATAVPSTQVAVVIGTDYQKNCGG